MFEGRVRPGEFVYRDTATGSSQAPALRGVCSLIWTNPMLIQILLCFHACTLTKKLKLFSPLSLYAFILVFRTPSARSPSSPNKLLSLSHTKLLVLLLPEKCIDVIEKSL
jgi:hypothetical protein